jgi:hypothetical protein
MTYPDADDSPLQIGEVGILQHLKRSSLNGLIAIVTGELKQRLLYSLSQPSDSEICTAYTVRVPGYPPMNERIDWCVKRHQLRRIDNQGITETQKTAEVDLLCE